MDSIKLMKTEMLCLTFLTLLTNYHHHWIQNYLTLPCVILELYTCVHILTHKLHGRICEKSQNYLLRVQISNHASLDGLGNHSLILLNLTYHFWDLMFLLSMDLAYTIQYRNNLQTPNIWVLFLLDHSLNGLPLKIVRNACLQSLSLV